MKKYLVSILLTFCAVTLYGQWQWGVSFDSEDYYDRISFDSISNPNCIWQVGHPSKTVFASSYSTPKSIMTDTLNSVPSNDISTFYLKHERDNSQPFHVFRLQFWYQLDGESTDYGVIEVSPDKGLNWVNLLTDDEAYNLGWMTEKPTLTGSTVGWQEFGLDLMDWASGFGDFPIAMTADTIIFRFTYYTDNNSAARDGWIIDDIMLEDWFESVEEIQNSNLISIYPNPANEQLTLKINQITNNHSIQVLNCQGQVVYSDNNFSDLYVDTKHLINGIYFLRFSNTKAFAIKKFVVKH